MKKTYLIIIITLTLMFSAIAGEDGVKSLSKKSNGEVKECFEGVNRAIFSFNKGLDNILVEPLAKGYRHLPSPIKSGTSNFISNLSLLVTIPNNVLQGEVMLAGKNTARFAVNSTIGILGLLDPASSLGLNDYEKEDYGQTLATWGFDEGCYLVLPVLGPSTARDTLGSLTSFIGGDAWYNVTVSRDTQHFSDFDYYASKGSAGVDFRAKNIESFDNLEENSMDFYASVKSLYLQNRQQKILNSKKVTPPLDDSDWDEIEEN